MHNSPWQQSCRPPGCWETSGPCNSWQAHPASEDPHRGSTCASSARHATPPPLCTQRGKAPTLTCTPSPVNHGRDAGVQEQHALGGTNGLQGATTQPLGIQAQAPAVGSAELPRGSSSGDISGGRPAVLRTPPPPPLPRPRSAPFKASHPPWRTMSKRRVQGRMVGSAFASRMTSVKEPRLQNSVMMQAGWVHRPMNWTMLGWRREDSRCASCS